jgi:hypothetical protein
MPSNLSTCIASTGDRNVSDVSVAICGEEIQSNLANWTDPAAAVQKVGCRGGGRLGLGSAAGCCRPVDLRMPDAGGAALCACCRRRGVWSRAAGFAMLGGCCQASRLFVD